MTVFTQIAQHRIRAVKSLAMISVFLAYGLTSGLLGPTMLDLQLMVSGTIEQVAYIMPGRSIGIVAGSLISKCTHVPLFLPQTRTHTHKACLRSNCVIA